MRGFVAALLVSASLAASERPALAESDGGWEVEATPRFWLLNVSHNPYIESTQFQQSNEDAVFTLYGFSLRVAPPAFSRSDFLLTFFRGPAHLEGRSYRAPGISSRHVFDVMRTDVELLYRRRVPDSKLMWLAGLRWIVLEEDSEADNGFVYPASNSGRLEEETNFYMGEVGVSFSTPLDITVKHVFFANFTTGAGYETQAVQNRVTSASPDVSGVFPFVDANVGYQYVISENISIHLRYRVFAIHEQVRDKILALHGPEVGVGFLFN